MDIDIDCEFLEDGETITLISIALVADDGEEYYAVNGEITALSWKGWKLRRRLRRHAWLMKNVVPHLPQVHGDARVQVPSRWLFNYASTLVKPRQQIAEEVRQFITGYDDPQLWAWYGAYDHVTLCQLWGRMIDLPEGIPMWTNDLKQEAVRLGSPALPQQAAGEHNALLDARHNGVVRRFLRGLAVREGV